MRLSAVVLLVVAAGVLSAGVSGQGSGRQARPSDLVCNGNQYGARVQLMAVAQSSSGTGSFFGSLVYDKSNQWTNPFPSCNENACCKVEGPGHTESFIATCNAVAGPSVTPLSTGASMSVSVQTFSDDSCKQSSGGSLYGMSLCSQQSDPSQISSGGCFQVSCIETVQLGAC